MKILRTLTLVALALTVAACSRTAAPPMQQPVAMPQPAALTAPAMPTPEPTQSAPIQQARLDAGNYGFIETTALPQLNQAARSAATDAQFYALQFGRPGAPRQWAGDQGTTGSVAVGPYVRVNNLDCRDFTHTVKVGGTDYVKKGTACREQNGNWNVVQGAA